MSLDGTDIVVLDTETTGLSPQVGDRILEIAAIRVKDGKEIAVFDRLINPERECGVGAYNVHGISMDDVKNAPKFAEVIDELNELWDGAEYLVAHNAKFDHGFLEHEFKIADKEFIPPKLFCTMEFSRELFPNAASHSLDNICKKFGIKSKDSTERHRALEDVRFTIKALDKMSEMNPNKLRPSLF